MRLTAKVALITGAGGGIGQAITELFVREGATVFAADIALPDRPPSDRSVPLTLDVTREADWARAVSHVVDEAGGLDILVNNAGVIAYEPLDALGMDAWSRLIAVDQTGVFLGMREAARVMRAQQAGSIVNVSSIWGKAAVSGAHAYHAAKGAVRQMTRNAAITYAGDGIRVNVVLPGFIHTPLTDAQDAALNESVIDATPMRRGGQPNEVAYGCLYLASDEASFITGAELAIDGGYLAQ
jgi:3alpha(or 20beta)-hydroxysteroid dehydrogenase